MFTRVPGYDPCSEVAWPWCLPGGVDKPTHRMFSKTQGLGPWGFASLEALRAHSLRRCKLGLQTRGVRHV